jgi:hypothetical protein
MNHECVQFIVAEWWPIIPWVCCGCIRLVELDIAPCRCSSRKVGNCPSPTEAALLGQGWWFGRQTPPTSGWWALCTDWCRCSSPHNRPTSWTPWTQRRRAHQPSPAWLALLLWPIGRRSRGWHINSWACSWDTPRQCPHYSWRHESPCRQL